MNIWTKLAAFSFFETERLFLRPFLFSDAADFYKFLPIQRIFPLFFQHSLS